MAYSYEVQRAQLFTDDGQRMLLRVRDHVATLLKQSGACTLGRAIDNCVGDSWTMLACVDRLVEIGELKLVGPQYPDVSTQEQVYVRGKA